MKRTLMAITAVSLVASTAFAGPIHTATEEEPAFTNPEYASMNHEALNIEEKFSGFSEHWSPRVIAEMNDYQFKLVKAQGEFVWHSHDDTDEAFIVVSGILDIEFRDGKVRLESGEMFVVPKGVEHRPVARDECRLMLVEPKGVVNTGDAGGQLTAGNDVWV